ncbi:MAG: hypothetical protein ACNA8O_14875 [Cyanobacteriota bacterium]|jgi:hypothetical protein
MHSRPPQRPEADPDQNEPLEGPLVDPGRSIGLRLLALVGAFSFLMLGISSLAPLLQPAPPPALPDQRDQLG